MIKRFANKIIKVPAMGDSISEGTLRAFHKKVGDFVKTDDEVAVIETDKVDIPINSSFTGKISKLLVSEETLVRVGQDLIEIDTDAKDTTSSQPSKPAESEQPRPKQESSSSSTSSSKKSTSTGKLETLKVPSLADSISEGVLKEWLKKEGDFINQDEQLTSVETDKVDVPINSPISGTLTKIIAQTDTKVVVGEPIANIQPGSAPESSTAASSPLPTQKPSQQPAPESKPQPAKAPQPSKVTQPTKAAQPTESFKPFSRTESRVKTTRMRQTVSKRLKESQNTAASLTTFNEVDMTNLMQFRKNYKEAVFDKYHVKFGFMSAFLKASALAMKDVPQINAVIDKEEIVYRDYVDISFAVATPKGLVTPVIRNCESKSMIDIEREVALMGDKAKKNQITLEDLAGGTFTVSNGGVFGSLYGTPIINLPQSAILGMHAIKERAVVVDGKVIYMKIKLI